MYSVFDSIRPYIGSNPFRSISSELNIYRIERPPRPPRPSPNPPRRS